MKFLKILFPYILIIIFSFFAFKPLLNVGFFPMHDDTQVVRIFEMAKSLKMGMLPVRWVLDLGYGLGYPIFNFYAPLSYYFGAAFNILGFDALTATKITMIAGILMSGMFMYLLAKQLFGKTGGLVSALFYTYAPFHALDIYVRGDLAEFWAYALTPPVFYGVWKIYKEKKLLFVFVTALAFAGLILSHNLSALMITPFLTLTVLLMSISLYRNGKKKTIMFLLGSLGLGVAVSCFYWLPALLEMNNTNVMSVIGGGSYYSDHFACLNQLWSSAWGYGGSAKGCIDGLSLMIGKLHIVVSFAAFLIGVILFNFKKYNNKENYFVIILSFLGFILSAFLTLEVSKFVWQSFPIMLYFQFPWRFILTASFFSSLLAGSLIFLFSILLTKNTFNRFKIGFGVLLILVLLFFNIKLFIPQKVLNVDSNYYTNEYSLKWTTSKISDEYLPKNIKKPVNAEQALLNKRIFSFNETLVEKFSDLISLTGILLIIIGIIKFRKIHE